MSNYTARLIITIPADLLTTGRAIARWPDLTPPTLAECQVFCSGAVLTTNEPDHSSV